MFKRIWSSSFFGSIVFFYHLSRWISWRLASVDGVVERVEIAKTLLSPDPRNPVDGWEPRVTSRYTVAGRLYRSNRVNYVSQRSRAGGRDGSYAQSEYPGYRPGGKVRIFYGGETGSGRFEGPLSGTARPLFPRPLALLVMKSPSSRKTLTPARSSRGDRLYRRRLSCNPVQGMGRGSFSFRKEEGALRRLRSDHQQQDGADRRVGGWRLSRGPAG